MQREEDDAFIHTTTRQDGSAVAFGIFSEGTRAGRPSNGLPV